MQEQAVTAGRLELVLTKSILPLGLKELDGVGPKTSKRLRERGLLDQRDLLLFPPRKYRRCAHFWAGPDMAAQRAGHVEFIAPVMQTRKPRPNTRQPVETVLDVNGQYIKVLWFNMARASFVRELDPGVWVHIRGELDHSRSIPQIVHPNFEILGARPAEIPSPHMSIEPVYPSLEGIKDATLRKAQLQALERLSPYLGEVVPQPLLQRHNLPSLPHALSVIHVTRPYHDVELFQRELKRAKKRLIYEEFYTLQLKLARDYADQRAEARAPQMGDRELGRQMVRQLPFTLTGDQRDAIATIAEDLSQPQPMRRLLQGDVGSGKTVVALMAAAIAVGNGYQVAMMAPTDILARQHLRRAEEFFAGLDIQMGFLGGSLGAAERRGVLEALASGQLQLVVGTHALFQEDVGFRKLGLVIIDEQHKFGVEQRELLLAKGESPHLLSMTATPIPRSLAHAVFGDLDLTVIREKPPGRQPIRTVLRDHSRAPRAYAYVRDRIREHGEQAYFVYPMVEASELVPDRKNVVEAAEKLSDGAFAELRLGVLHGRLDAKNKDEIMQQFAGGELDVLCATTVIEVGVDVPNATLMIIESPEVFGLSQLHQLRGRVGRGEAASMCVLLAGGNLTEEAHERLVSFRDIDDGFELAEVDLRIRGPGQFLGVRQAGMAEFRFGDLHRDADLLAAAREDARRQVLAE